MPQPAARTRSKDLAMIHIAAKDLGMDDSTYRDMLWSVGRVRSAKDLDAGGREAVINHMKRCGWQRKPETATRYKRGTPAALIRWLWTQLADAGLVENRSDRALRRYIGNHAGLPGRAGTEIAPQHLDRREAGQVIEQLKRWLARKEEGNA